MMNKNMKSGKKTKIIAYMDSPTVATGFATVSRNILEALYKTGRYEIDVLGINYWGNPHTTNYRIFPVGTNSDHDPYGRKKVFGMIPQMMGDQTILFFLQDTFILDFLPQLHEKLNADGKKYVSLAYFPVDGKPKEQWLKNVNSVDYPVTYSEWGKKQIFDVYPEFNKDLMTIPHGANLKDFYVLNQKDITSFKSQFFGENRDKFIFSNIGRNQQRKDIPRMIMAFKEFQKQVPNSILYNQMAKKDQGWNLPEVCNSLGLSTTKDVIFPENFGPNQGYPIEVVNMIYNCSDCIVSTTLAEGWGLCIHPETNVYTENGVKYMNELTINDKVLSSNGTYNNVEAIMTKEHNDDLYEITTWMSNIPIKTSPEHGFLVKILDDKYEWKKASELVVGDSLVFPKGGQHNNVNTIDVLELIRPSLNVRQIKNIVETETHFKIQSNFMKEGRLIPKKLNITEDLMYLFGLYLAEGHVGASKMDGIGFSFHKDEKDLIFFVENFMADIFGLPCTYTDHTSRGKEYKGQSLLFYSSSLAYLFKVLFGLGARNKYIHSILLGQPNNMLQKLLYGEFLGDGCYCKTTYELSISTTSKHIAYGLRLMMARMGIISSVRTSRVEYDVNISGTSKRKLLDLFNIYYDKNRSWKNGFDRAKQDNKYLLLPIKDITVSKYKGKLVDIQVANTNDFVAENCVVHNSWIEAMATKTPVIFPDNTALTENITEDRGYLVKSGTTLNLQTILPNDNEILRSLTDIPDMVKTMLHVYNNYDEAMEKAENAYNWISMKMDWQGDIAKKWVEVFDKAAEDLDKNNPTISDSEKDKVIEAEAV